MIVNEARVETFERIFETKPEHVDGAKVRCWYCGTEITYRTAAIDHIFPRAKGGGDEIENLAATCRPCNTHKCAEPVESLRRHIGMKALGVPYVSREFLEYCRSNPMTLGEFAEKILDCRFYFEERMQREGLRG